MDSDQHREKNNINKYKKNSGIAEIILPGVADSFYLLRGFYIVKNFPWSLDPPRNPLNLHLYRTLMVESQNFLDPVLAKP